MERCCKTTIRLSPNEVESVLADEKKKWKIFRLQQVRAQSREQTCNILRAADKEEEKLKGILKQRLHKEWQGENERKQQSLETEYTDGLLKFGEAHKEAQKERETVETFKQRQVEGNRRAAERGKAAFDLLNKTKIEAEKEQTKNKSRKQTVLEKEKRRANVIAKMPTPPKFKPQLRKIPVKPKKVKFYEAGTFTTSSYLPSSVHIIREDESDEQFRRNAREAARSENEKLELARKLNALKEKENEKRTQERANVARKKERTRKMFSQLMDELNQAEQNHQLSDYLQECDYNFEEDVDLEKREKEAERKVEKLLEEEMEQNVGRRQMWKREVHPSDISETQETSSSPSASPSSSPSTGGIGDIYLPQLTDKVQSSKRVEIDSSDSSSIHVSFRATQKEGKDGDQVDFLAGTRGRPTIDAEDIHFKETVPVHVLPSVKHKFFEDVWMPREDPPSTEISSSSVAIESPTPESSFDEIKVRVKFQPAPEAVTPTSSEGTSFSRGVSSSSVSTEYLEYPDTLRKKLEQHARQRAIRATSTLLPAPLPTFPPPAELSSGNSTSSTSYKALPDTPPEDAADIWENMKQIQGTRLKIKKIIEELKPPSETPPEKDFQTFKTPPRIYTESLKTDSSGERPKSKRQKFEEQKRRVLKHYMQRLMRMKQEELKQMSVSTVRSSGIDLSSDVSLGKLIGGQLELAFPTFSPIGVPTSQASSDDLDTIPTKLSSSSSSSRPSDTSRVTIPAELVSNSSSVTTGTEMHCQKREVLQRMIQLQKLKKKLIVQQQRALGRDVQKIEQIQSSPQTTTSNGDSSVSASLNAESSVEWSSADTYQTPSREDSTLSRGKYSPASPTEREQSPVMQQIGQQVSAGYQDDNELPLLSTFRSNKDVSAGSSNSTPLPEGRQTQKDSSSSVASLPDMTEVLKNFGLTWAVSMIKKMDIAEEGRSSVTS